MNSTACSQCGEKILQHWTLCPVCALPFADAVSPPAKVSHQEDSFTTGLDLACVQCKGFLNPDAQICPHCHVLIVRRYCSGCSRLIPDQTTLCPYCATPATAKRSRLKFYLQTAAIVILAGSIVGGLLFIAYRVPTQRPESAAPLPVPLNVPLEQKSILTTDVKPTPVEIQRAEPVQTEQPAAPTEQDHSLEVAVRETNDDPVLEPAVEEVTTMETLREEEEILPSVPAFKPVDKDWKSRGTKLKQGRKLSERASSMMKQGRYSDATVVLREALHTFPEQTKDLSYGEALYKLGICLRRKGEPAQAIPVLQQAMRFPYLRGKVIREVEAATAQLQRTKVKQASSGTRR